MTPETKDATWAELCLVYGLPPEAVCERPDDGVCEKCGARNDQGCQLSAATPAAGLEK